MSTATLGASEIERIVSAKHHAPRSILGFHEIEVAGEVRWVVRIFEPEARSARLYFDDETSAAARAMEVLHPAGLFELVLEPRLPLCPYQVDVEYHDGARHVRHDPYFFAPQLSDLDLYLFGQGDHHHIYRKLGAHPGTHAGVAGTFFAVWAPSARRVSVVGSFNHWDGRRHAMHVRENSGIWELFVPAVESGALYKYEILAADGQVLMKSDPYGFCMQLRPETASVVCRIDGHTWDDAEWLERRARTDPLTAPLNIFEVHPGSWKRMVENGEERFFTWDELAEELIPYVVDMGYTHIEVMGMAEHPLDLSWGYQVVGYYAASARYGEPEALMRFVDRCHQSGIGVIMDWVPAHFPRDAHGLASFDGSHLYEHADPRLGEHADWGTNIFNYGRNEVRNFLVANALFWLDVYHLDGLRVDAVASMLYLDYSRAPGEWIPNRLGGRENLDAIDFLRQLNQTIFRYHPGILSIAEESTAFAGVTTPPDAGGLGFNFKWNMGWMNDTLRYIGLDPLYRRHHGSLITFALIYAWSENFILPISHDEVVHGKGSLIEKMPGDDWQRRATLRLYKAFMIAHPGKQLMFMGQEFGQPREWSEARSLDWHLLENPAHKQLRSVARALNRLYRDHEELYSSDCTPAGFEWLQCNDDLNSVYAFARYAAPREDKPPLVFVANFTPVPRPRYALWVPSPGRYRVLLDTDAKKWGGSGYNSQTVVTAGEPAAPATGATVVLDLPPLGALFLQRCT